jgi:nucleoside-diphosphate-sugar epimerase
LAKRAFITGATGFIGSHLLEALIQDQWSVRALAHNRTIHQMEGLEIVKGDIGDDGLLIEALKDIDILFHLAAALGGSLLGQEEFYRINVEGTQNVLRAATKAGVRRVIHFSSAGVLGSVKTGETADEDYPTHPISAYDITKLEGERIALQKAREDVDVVVIRPGWVYGPTDRRTFKLIKAIARKKFLLITRGAARQTPVFIDDLVAGTLLIADKGKRGEIYNISGLEVLTVREIVEKIGAATGNRIPRFTLPLFPVRMAAWSMEKTFRLFKKEAPLTRGKLAFFIHPKPLAIDKAVRELGYAPQTDFQTGVTQTVKWYREQGWL